MRPSPSEYSALKSVEMKLRNAGSPDQRRKYQEIYDKLMDRVVNGSIQMTEKLKQLGIDLESENVDWTSDKVATKAMRAISQAKSTGFDMMYEYWLNAILSSPATQARNIFGNTIFTGWEFSFQRWAEIAVNWALPGSDLSGAFGLGTTAKARRQKAGSATVGELSSTYRAGRHAILSPADQIKSHFAGMAPGRSKVWQAIWKSWETGLPVTADEFGGGRTKLEGKFSTAIPGKAGQFIRVPTRVLLAMDEAAKQIIGHMALETAAFRLARQNDLEVGTKEFEDFIREETTNPDSLSWKKARTESERLTLQTKLGDFGQKFLGLRESMPGMRYLFPFVTTPGHLFKHGIRKSPLGTLRMLWKMIRMGTVKLNWKSSLGYEYTREELVKDLAEQFLAWGVLLAIWPLIVPDDEDGLPRITGTAPKGWGERELQYRTAPPMSIRTSDGQWISYSGIEPMSIFLATTVDGIHNFHLAKTTKEAGVVLTDALASISGQVSNLPLLRGMGDLLRIIENPVKGSVRYVTNFGASWNPNIIRAGLREGDDYVRQTQLYGEELDAFISNATMRTVQRGIPAEAIAAPAKVDLWGNSIKKHTGVSPATDWGYRMFSPLKKYKVELGLSGNLNRMMLNWNNAHPSDVLAPRQPNPWTQVHGEKVFMNDDEYHKFMREAGKLSLEWAKNINWNFDNPTERDRVIVIKLVNRARAAVRKKFVAGLIHKKDRRVSHLTGAAA